MLESYRKLQQKPKTVPQFKNVLQLILSVLPEKTVDTFNSCESLPQASVSQRWIF